MKIGLPKEIKDNEYRVGLTPAGVQAWTLQLLAEQLFELRVVETISHEAVRQLLKKTN